MKVTTIIQLPKEISLRVKARDFTSSAFGVSYHTVNRYVELMETYFLVDKLVPYYQNVGKRLAKSYKLYFRDSGLLHYLLNISSVEALREALHS